MSSIKKVTSTDGTKIAYIKQGHGPEVIIVDGATGSIASGTSLALAELLSPSFTVYCYDRRGRGDSTDTLPFTVDREIEDIEALVDIAGGSAYVYGMSSGASLALEAAIKLGRKVSKLALFEAPYDSSDSAKEPWRQYCATLSRYITENRRGDAAALFMKFVGAPDDMIKNMRHSPMWPAMEAVAPTLLYDAAAVGEDRAVPVDRASSITAKTLVLDGAASLTVMPFMRATASSLSNAIPGARHETIKGQGHNVDPKALAPALSQFFTET